MPNHCDSDLTVTGPEEAVAEFMGRYVTAHDGTVLNLNAIRPYPEEYAKADQAREDWMTARQESGLDFKAFTEQHGPMPEDGFNQGGYSWCLQNWGTKWGCYPGYGDDEHIVERSPGQVVLHFQTAWSPFDTGLLVEVSEALPSLHFQYDSYECGMAFQCHTTVEAGYVVADTNGSYDGERGG